MFDLLQFYTVNLHSEEKILFNVKRIINNKDTSSQGLALPS